MSGEKIKEARKRLGLSQYELAEKVGISRASISRIETCETENMSVYTAIRIAKVLGLSMDFLFLQ